jgi:iron(II)-dependent oxidoreductase
MEVSTRALGGARAEQYEALIDTRERTLALVAGLGEEDLARVVDPLLSPLLWDLGHVANFEERWLLGSAEQDLADLYNPFQHPRADRGELPYLHSDRCFAYMDDVRERVLAGLEHCDPELLELVIQHEQQHNETMLQLLRQLPGYRAPAALADRRAPQPLGRPDADWIEFPAGSYLIGSPDGEKLLTYDNERPAHERVLEPFAIAASPVTFGDYLEWVDAGVDRDPPDGCSKVDGVWMQSGFGEAHEVDHSAPVCHISWFEAEAYARAHAARLPSEFEWEVAASYEPGAGAGSPRRINAWGDAAWTPQMANLDHTTFGTLPVGSFDHGPGPLEMNGQVWEWTSSEFSAYPGFTPMAYERYSAPFFDAGYRVLRGGSWATRARSLDNRFRNWDLPERRQIFAGLRLARGVADR